jgi:hypothetical protein
MCQSFDFLDHEGIVSEIFRIGVRAELRPMGTVRDSERGKKIFHLLKVQEDIHGGFCCAVFIHRDRDVFDPAFRQPWLFNRQRFCLRLIRGRVTSMDRGSTGSGMLPLSPGPLSRHHLQPYPLPPGQKVSQLVGAGMGVEGTRQTPSVLFITQCLSGSTVLSL